MHPNPNSTPSKAELERQKNAFIQKLVEIQRKQRKAPQPPKKNPPNVSR